MSKTTLYGTGHVAIAERQTINGSEFIVVHKPCWNMREAALLRDWLNQAMPASAQETSAGYGPVRCQREGCGNLGTYIDGRCGHHTTAFPEWSCTSPAPSHCSDPNCPKHGQR